MTPARTQSTATASQSTNNTNTTSNTSQTNNIGSTGNTGASDFQKLFTASAANMPGFGATTTAPAVTIGSPVANAAPTPESVFGANPWESNPVGRNPDGSYYSYNPLYFATASTASKVAQMLGGKVVAMNDFTAPGSPFVQQQPNMMVQMPDGRLINAGLVAAFYTHGYPQSYIDGLIQQQINGTNN
jgi:hypothetical protein